MRQIRSFRGYSLIEVLGVVALLLTLALIALPSVKNFTEGGKQGASISTVSALNAAAQKFDQAGGLLTAQVLVPSNVSSITDHSELPEFGLAHPP